MVTNSDGEEVEEEVEEEPVEEPPEEEEDDENKPKPRFFKEIYPDSAVALEGTDQFLRDKARKLPTEVIVGQHWLPADMERRLTEYNDANSISKFRSEDTSVEGFFYPLIRFF